MKVILLKKNKLCYNSHLRQFVALRHMVINDLLRCRKVERGHQFEGRTHLNIFCARYNSAFTL